MKRITVDEVKAAYEKTGLNPIRGRWLGYAEQKQCGCGLTACCMASGKSVPPWCHDAASEMLGIDYQYACGFTWGFDGQAVATYTLDPLPENFEAGYADGVAAAKAVFA